MIGSSRNVRVFVFTRPVDIRLGFDGLYVHGRNKLCANPLSGDIFLFIGKKQERFDLKQRLSELEKKLYGSTSERRTDDDSEQEHSPDPASDKPDIPEKKTRKQRGHGPRPQPALPVIDVLHLFEQADLVCPHCGKPMRVIDGHEQVHFEVDIFPALLVLKRHSQQKAACNSGCLQQWLPHRGC